MYVYDNKTKGYIDTVDKLCAFYNCTRNTWNWPNVIFYAVFNVAAINSMVLCIANNVWVAGAVLIVQEVVFLSSHWYHVSLAKASNTR